MKKILIIASLILGFVNFAKAQTDYCKDIIIKIDDMKHDTTYYSPVEDRTSGMYLKKATSFFGSFIFFTITKPDADYETKGILVKFDDGSAVSYPADIDCSYLNADQHYLYKGVIMLNDENIENFKTKKVVKYRVANVDVPITDAFATKFRAWVSCIVNKK